LGSEDRESLSDIARSFQGGRQDDLESDAGEQVLRVPDRDHPSLVTPGIRWINPHRYRKIIKHISRGARDIGGFFVWVEFPLTGSYRKVGPVRVIHAGYIKYLDRGTSEKLIKNGLAYSASDPGIKKCDLFVLVFDWAGERHVRRMFRGRSNDNGGYERLMWEAAYKVALTTSKDERSMYRRLHS
jgi:hypothetical protein